MDRRLWTRDETIVAFNVFCKIPFGKSSKTHPLIIKYANLIGRTPSALNMKVGNIGRLDPSLRAQGISGLTHGSRVEEEVWDEFSKNPDRLAYESERLVAEFSHQSLVQIAEIDEASLPKGKERETVIKQRVNQSFFRSAVLSSYDCKCCISGIGGVDLLEACHIIDWSIEEKSRTNPQNGLCMNPFFHKAYDKYYMGITPDQKIVISDTLLELASESTFRDYLTSLNGRPIISPKKFLPQKEYLDAHYSKFLQKQR